MSQFILFSADPAEGLPQPLAGDPVTMQDLFVIAARGYAFGKIWRLWCRPGPPLLQNVGGDEQHEVLTKVWFSGFDQGIKENPNITHLPGDNLYYCYEVHDNK